jgi:geranylgeranyl pyrophosphate synthase
VTFPLLAILPRLDSRERRTVQAVFPSSGAPDPDAVERVIELVRARGGIDATRQIAREYAERAREALLPLSVTPAREVLDAAVDYVLGRDR